MKKILLHICCGICALASIEALEAKGYKVSGFFFNPNIWPREEYLKRLQAAQEASAIKAIELIEGRYNAQDWFDLCSQYKDQPEGGQRCELCYEFRLKEAAEIAEKNACDYFTTTLTISPHKSSSVIAQIGKKIGDDRFLELDLKKKDGFKKTIQEAKKHNLYRQNYCGCMYSKK